MIHRAEPVRGTGGSALRAASPDSILIRATGMAPSISPASPWQRQITSPPPPPTAAHAADRDQRGAKAAAHDCSPERQNQGWPCAIQLDSRYALAATMLADLVLVLGCGCCIGTRDISWPNKTFRSAPGTESRDLVFIGRCRFTKVSWRNRESYCP